MVHEDLRAAISRVLGSHGELATKWALVVESVGSDGERGLWLAAGADAKAWDTMGLLDYAVQRERAEILAREIGRRQGD